MYIFQPDRYLLTHSIRNYGRYISGRTLDVGAGEYNRYGEFFHASEYVRMDVVEGKGVDVVGRAEAMPFADASFDSVVCTQVFEHLDQPVKAAQEIFRVLRPGGKLLLTVPQTSELHEEPNDFFRYTNYGLKSMLERAGFTVLECEARGNYFSMLAQLRIRHYIDSLNLYHRPILGRMFSLPFKVYGRLAIWRDAHSKSVANKKHTLGWTVVAQK